MLTERNPVRSYFAYCLLSSMKVEDYLAGTDSSHHPVGFMLTHIGKAEAFSVDIGILVFFSLIKKSL